MNRLNNTESAVFIIWMLHFQRTPFSYNLEITTSVVVPCGCSKTLPLNLFSVVIFTVHLLILWDCGIHNFLESRVALNTGLGGVVIVAYGIISHEQTQ